MKILNYTNFVQFVLKSSDDKKNNRTKAKTFDYKTNPNISYNALNSSFFYNQKLIVKNARLKSCAVSFKANSAYYNNILTNIMRFYKIESNRVDLKDVIKIGNDLLSSEKKHLKKK